MVDKLVKTGWLYNLLKYSGEKFYMDNNSKRILNKYDKGDVLERGLTWQQIKEKYPHQRVGLVNIIPGINDASVMKADVLCTDRDTDYDDMCMLYVKGEIDLRYTTLDEDMQMETCPW